MIRVKFSVEFDIPTDIFDDQLDQIGRDVRKAVELLGIPENVSVTFLDTTE